MKPRPISRRERILLRHIRAALNSAGVRFKESWVKVGLRFSVDERDRKKFMDAIGDLKGQGFVTGSMEEYKKLKKVQKKK